MHTKQYSIHVPVLLESVVKYLHPRAGESYADMTAGYGGHAQAILEKTEAPELAVLVDRDSEAIEALQPLATDGVRLLHADFLSASQTLAKEGIRFDIVLADLGVSSLHFDKQDRGFSFKHNAPLDMRMDTRQALTAADIVNTYSSDQLLAILREYGEEPRSKRIVAMLCARRPFTHTSELAEAIAAALPGRGKIHPATRTFQALRIAVNDELGMLKQAIPVWLELLAPGGRLGIISFHSLEDRIVKQAFASVCGDRYDAPYELLTSKPVVADDAETAFNPRARSAKFRAVANKNNKEREHYYANSRKK